jgi:hypothetical protein
MGQKGCEQCRILLEGAGTAISAHAKAIADLAGAVGDSPDATLGPLEAAVRDTSAALESAVERYENHQSTHELKGMTAGSE